MSVSTTLYIDCFSGLSGDMLLGALLDLGLPRDHLERELGRLGLPAFALRIARVHRHGIGAFDLRVEQSQEGSAVEHRHLGDIRAMITTAGFEPDAERLALDIFGRLAAAEAKIHGVEPEEVHFHEVGALDSIVDVCGVAIGLAWLRADRVVCAPVPAPRGFVHCAHGCLPLPAPATMELLRGAVLHPVDGEPGEWVTPTGAAVLAATVSEYGPIPAFRVDRIGYGAGDRDLGERPNLLRLIVGTSSTSAHGERDHDLLIEANIDDMSPELFGYLTERLLESGAHDVWLTPIQMKKGRPGTKLSVLCDSARRPGVVASILRESTTIGLRMIPVERYKTAHSVETVDTNLGPVRVKVARDGCAVVNVAPEYEDCRRVARETGLPLKEVTRRVLLAIGEKPL